MPPAIEEADESVKIQVGRSFQEVLRQRVLEVVDPVGWISEQSIVKQFAVMRSDHQSVPSAPPDF